MRDVRLLTSSSNWNIALATNATDTSFPSKIPTLTEPTGAGVIKMNHGGGLTQNVVKVLPYGIGDDNDVFNLRVIAWDVVKRADVSDLWVPTILVELVCTMSAMVGVANAAVLATERFCDTITLTTGNDDVNVSIISPGGDVGATARIDFEGSQKIEFTFDQSTGSPTSFNTLYKLY